MDNRDDLKRDSLIEKQMREDIEFALERTDFVRAMEMLEGVQSALAGYGHEYTLKELVEMW